MRNEEDKICESKGIADTSPMWSGDSEMTGLGGAWHCVLSVLQSHGFFSVL